MKTIMIVAAHPDDEVLGCGGTIARFASEGAMIHVIFLADGVSARTKHDGMDEQIALIARQKAANAASQVLGVQSVIFGNFADNRMDAVHLLEIIQFVEKQVSHYKPEMILTHHAGDLNVDHRLVHQAVVTASRPQPGQCVKTLLFFEVPSSTEWQTPASSLVFAPNWFIDISHYLAIRSKALAVYATEMRDWPHSRSHHAMDCLARWRGATVGVEAAEAFMLGRTLLIER